MLPGVRAGPRSGGTSNPIPAGTPGSEARTVRPRGVQRRCTPPYAGLTTRSPSQGPDGPGDMSAGP